MAMAPEALHPGRAPTLPGNVKATSTRLFCCVSSAERASEPRSLCTMLGSCGQNTLGAHLEPGPRGPNWHLSPGEP